VSVAVLTVGLLVFVLAQTRHEIQWAALLVLEALVLAVALLLWLAGCSIRCLTASRSD
jgi:hypothetical protein